ncbi:MAG: SET domain-containing protein-lysine N-methyltransferase [Sphingobacteriia bacterium]|nr:MAG: SET domain-containing protein-lysine N-methyltransferase [Sphingobacteriia bacterium]
MILSVLYIDQTSNKGRGVFTAAEIPANTTIEIAPVLVLNEANRLLVEQTMLYNYIFEWGDGGKQAAVALGYVSIYNHAIDYNCTYEMDYDALTISIKTVRAILHGEELFINYNPVGEEQAPVWFELG